MAKRITVRGIPRSEPDVRLYVAALVELARQLQADEQAAAERVASPQESPTEKQERAHD